MKTEWDNHHKRNAILGGGIMDTTANALPKPIVAKAAPAQKVGQEKRDETVRQDGPEQEVSQHAEATHGGEPQKCQWPQQLICKHNCNSNGSLNSNTNPNLCPHPLQSEGGRQCYPKPRVIWHPLAQAAHTPTSGSCVAVGCLLLIRDGSVLLPRTLDHEIVSAIDRVLV
jgi:hypothetical protein